MTLQLIRVGGEVQAVESTEGYVDFELMGPVPEGVDPSQVGFDGEGIPDLTPVWIVLRADRARRLRDCDWTQLGDVAEAVRDIWQPYRQALRDLPAVTSDPFNPEWPDVPGD